MDKSTQSNKLQRRAFVAELLKHRNGALIIPGLGSPTWDCFAAGDSPEYLYSWGAWALRSPLRWELRSPSPIAGSSRSLVMAR